MTYEHFRRITSVLVLPVYEKNELEKLVEKGPSPDLMQWIRIWLHSCNRQWRTAWEPGTFLTVDKTTVSRAGLDNAHLTYILQAIPFRITVKVTCCAESEVMLHTKFLEGLRSMPKKP